MSDIIEDEYREFIADLKRRVAQAQAVAARVVNRELILLYWDIGEAIARKQQIANWGDSVVEQIALDLKAAFPTMSGFSPRNVWYMRRFYRHYTSSEFLAQAAPEFASSQLTSILPQAVAESSPSERWAIKATGLSISGRQNPTRSWTLSSKTQPMEFSIRPKPCSTIGSPPTCCSNSPTANFRLKQVCSKRMITVNLSNARCTADSHTEVVD